MAKINKKKPTGLWVVFILFTLFAMGAFVGYVMKSDAGCEMVEPIKNEDLMIILNPTGCEICDNIVFDFDALEETCGCEVRYLEFDANIKIPGVLFLTSDKASDTFPFDSELNLRRVLCYEFALDNFCTPDVIAEGPGEEAELTVNNETVGLE